MAQRPNLQEKVQNARYQNWSYIAVARELIQIKNQTGNDNPSKPGSPLAVSIMKIASICKGAGREYIIRERVLQRIIANSQQYHLEPKEIERIWNRAIKTAVPRYPKETRNGRQP